MKECKFIRAGNNIYVPPVELWLEGWTRQRWLESYFKEPDRIRVASVESWEFLCNRHDVSLLKQEGNLFKEGDVKKHEGGRSGTMET